MVRRLLAHPLAKRLAPNIYGALICFMVVFAGGNTWIEATARVAAAIMMITAFVGGAMTRNDGMTAELLWIPEALPSLAVFILVDRMGLNTDGSAPHMAMNAICLGLIMLAPFLGAAFRHFLSRK